LGSVICLGCMKYIPRMVWKRARKRIIWETITAGGKDIEPILGGKAIWCKEAKWLKQDGSFLQHLYIFLELKMELANNIGPIISNALSFLAFYQFAFKLRW
jgi:hypothetical protein